MIKCRLGFHDFRWPPHYNPFSPGGGIGWRSTFGVECARGCGARRLMDCDSDNHWTDRHPEPLAEQGEQG